MKQCKVCSSKYGSDIEKCPKCGSEDYLAICEKCGKAFASEICPDCGTQKLDNKKVHKKITFGRILLWIFFLPVMATIAIWKKKEWKIILKIGLTIFLWGIILISGVISSNNTSNMTQSNSQTLQISDYIESCNTIFEEETDLTGWQYSIKGNWEDYTNDQQKEIAFYLIKESISKTTTQDIYVWGENQGMPAFNWNLEDGGKYNIVYCEFGERSTGKEPNYRTEPLSEDEIKALGIQ